MLTRAGAFRLRIASFRLLARSFSLSYFKANAPHKNSSLSLSEEASTLNIRSFAPTEESVVSVDDFSTSSPANCLHLKTGKLARFADGAAVAEHGDCSVLATVVSRVSAKGSGGGGSFLPLNVDYRHKAAAAGRIPTNFLRRELGVSEAEILTGRLIDRSVRPFFPDGYFCETQLICSTLAVDAVHDPAILGVNAASAALAVSDIPWLGPVAAVRMGYAKGKGCLVNPDRSESNGSLLNMVVTAAPGRKLVMLELGAQENLNLDIVMEAIEAGMVASDKVIAAIDQLREKCGKPKRAFAKDNADFEETIAKAAEDHCSESVRAILGDFSHDKISRDKALQAAAKATRTAMAELFFPKTPSSSENGCEKKEKDDEAKEKAESAVVAEKPPQANLEAIVAGVIRRIYRKMVFENGLRCDGRTLTQLRAISCAVDLYKPLHGSALFQRGQTQCLCTVTFDSPDAAFRADAISALAGSLPVREKNFMLHYEFPPFATNEVASGKSNRREIGHGALAEKALRSVVPQEYPFTIRLTSQVLESNGSSSMASVCGGSLALMDAGVLLAEPCSGVAIGLFTDPDMAESDEAFSSPEGYRILTDISGFEDYMGLMDFKIAGTRSGITAAQLDMKIRGMPLSVVRESFEAAQNANGRILDIMATCTDKPRSRQKENGPQIAAVAIPTSKRAKVFGSYQFRQMQSDLGVRLSQTDDAAYSIFAPNQSLMSEAQDLLTKLLKDEREPELEFGAIYTAKITELRDNGVMIQLHPDMEPALLHNSQLCVEKVVHPSVVPGIEVGKEIRIKYFGRDPISGVHRMSRKVLMIDSPGARRLFPRSAEEVEKRPLSFKA